MMSTTYVGLDAHRDTIQVAVLSAEGERVLEFEALHDVRGVKRLATRLRQTATGPIRCCYEAGPCGYSLQRHLQALGIECVVIAPSLVPIRPGERIKTDRRDARKLATLLRADLLTAVQPPTPEAEAVRDLCRCREDAKADLLRSRQRLTKLLQRRGLVYRGGRQRWTQAHRRWLEAIHLDHGADRAVFEDYVLAVAQVEERVRALEAKLEAVAVLEPYREPVGWLRCFRGIDTVTAMTIVAELHDFRRFRSPRELMAYLGLVPSEHSSGQTCRRGAITKAGNRHVRRVLVEAAWHYRHRPRHSPRLTARRTGQPGRVRAIADKAQQRLHGRFAALLARGKPPAKIVIAIARELVGFLWVTLQPAAAG
jgi:transposase